MHQFIYNNQETEKNAIALLKLQRVPCLILHFLKIQNILALCKQRLTQLFFFYLFFNSDELSLKKNSATAT